MSSETFLSSAEAWAENHQDLFTQVLIKSGENETICLQRKTERKQKQKFY